MLVLFSLSSCFEIESTISVKKDGSGTVSEQVVLGAQMLAMMKMGAQEGAEDPLASFNEEALKAKAAEYGKGVEFVSVKNEEKEGRMFITALYKFDDISTLEYKPGAIMGDGSEPEEEDKEPTIGFDFKDGTLTVMVPEPDADDFALGDAEMSEEEMMMAAPMMAGMKISAKLVFEGGIESTNATYQDENTVILMSMDMDELLKNEGGLKAVKTLQVENRADFGKAVAKIKGIEMEHQEKVTVKLK